MTGYLTLYCIITFIMAIGGAMGMTVNYDYPEHRRTFARIFLLSPLWPLLIVWVLVRTWRWAEIGKGFRTPHNDEWERGYLAGRQGYRGH